MKSQNHELILRYLRNQLNADEKERFHQWLHASAANKSTFFEVKAIYDACRALPEVDLDQSWESLLEKRRRLEKKRSRPVIRILKYALVAVCAGLVTLLAERWMNDRMMEPAQTVFFVSGRGLVADSLLLPDGSLVRLAPQTRLGYSSDYGKKDRQIHLEGEAFFMVEKLPGKPFVVHSKGQRVEALGTRFNVMAYPKDSLAVITLFEGRVGLTAEAAKEKVLLKHSGMQAIYNERQASFSTRNAGDLGDVSSWMEGYYRFSDQRLDDILHRIGMVLDVSFTITTPELRQKRFTGTFYRTQSVQDILAVIQLSIPITYTIENNQVRIKQKRQAI